MSNADSARPEIGQRILVTNDTYGRWTGEQGTVVPMPPEIAAIVEREGETGFTRAMQGTVWFRFDDMDERAVAVGLYPDQVEVISTETELEA